MRTHAAAPPTQGPAGRPAPAPSQAPPECLPHLRRAMAAASPQARPSRHTCCQRERPRFGESYAAIKMLMMEIKKSEHSHSKAVFVLKWSNTHNKLNLKSTF